MQVSPGISINELDFSQYAPALATTVVGMVGAATKGPADEPTLITNEADMVRIFGKPLLSDYGLQAARLYLQQGNQLYYSRVASSDLATATIIIKDDPADTTDVVQFEAINPGSWGNNIQVKLGVNAEDPTLWDVTVYAPLDNSSNLRIAEQFVKVSFVSTHARFIDTVINEGLANGYSHASSYIKVVEADYALTPLVGTYSLVLGNDGIATLDDADYIGVYTGQKATGLKAFANEDKLAITVLVAPGATAPAVLAEITAICDKRNDCFGVFDTPIGLDVQGAVDFHNGSGPYAHAAFSSDRTAIYWPWIEVFDPYNEQKLFVPPSGAVVGQYAYNDLVGEPWFAPAGLQRGKITAALNVEYSADEGERILLGENGNTVNAIVNFAQDGVVIFAQRTCKRTPSALDRINVRRGVLQMQRVTTVSVRSLLFEPGDERTWNQITAILEPYYEQVKLRRGIDKFEVKFDKSTNPNIVRDNNTVAGKIFITPVKSGEKIEIDFGITSAGATFTELISG